MRVQIVENQQWKKGMGSSLKMGLENVLKKWPNTTSLLILVCDQPMLTAEHLQKIMLAATQSEKKIIASFYSNVLGVPALFKKEFFNELLSIDDSEGAKKLIERHKDEVAQVEFIGGEMDIDTPEDLQRLLGR